MQKFALRKPTLIPLITTILAVGMMLSLGVWQLQRLAWKEHLVHQLEQAKSLPVLTTLPPDRVLSKHEFRSVLLKGRFLHEKEFHLAGRYHKSELGYAILTPLQMDDGRIILVNRGWVPAEKKQLATRPETAPGGKVTVRGMIRVTGLTKRFLPAGNVKDNIWFSIEWRKMGDSAGLLLVPAIIEQVGEGTETNALPLPSDGVVTLRNDHLGYAITWFGIGLACLVIFLIYHRKK